MKEFLKKELYSFRAVAAILARWLLLAVPTGLVCGAVGTAFHLAVEQVTEWRAEHIWLLWLLPVAGLAIVALYKVTGCEGMGTNNVIRAVHSGESVSPLLGLPAGFSAAVGLVSVFCGATNTLIPSILLAYELFGGVGLELIALGCGVCYMLSGTHGLYSSQLFVTEKLLSEYTESWGKRLHH